MQSGVLTCPVCRAPLVREGHTLVCGHAHSYDLAREGYVNLLRTQKGGTHGDSREMLLSRRDFLDGGHYAFLADAACRLLASRLSRGACVLDAGCGEGYYLSRLAAALRAAVGEVHLFGIDISREALRLAMRRVPQMTGAVASLYEMPIADGALDAILCLFAPLSREEYCRTLKRGGLFCMAVPEARHLYGMKAVLYDTPYENEVADSALEGFRLLAEEQLFRTVCLQTREEIAALFAMTPYFHRTNAVGRERLAACDTLTTELAFRLFLYERI